MLHGIHNFAILVISQLWKIEMLESCRRFAGNVESVSNAEFIFLIETHHQPEHRKQEAKFLEKYADPSKDFLYLEAPTNTEKIERTIKSLFPQGSPFRIEGWNDPKIYELEQKNDEEISTAVQSGAKLCALIRAGNLANCRERESLRKNIITFINNNKDNFPNISETLDDRTLIQRLKAKIETSERTFAFHHYLSEQQYLIDIINRCKSSKGKKFIVAGRGHLDRNVANGVSSKVFRTVIEGVERLMKCLEKTSFIVFTMGREDD